MKRMWFLKGSVASTERPDLAAAVRQINIAAKRFETLTAKQVLRWRVDQAMRLSRRRARESFHLSIRRGRKVSEAFENDVWARLVLAAYEKTIDPVTGEEKIVVSVLHNVAYNYEMIRRAAKDAQTMEEWQQNERVKNLKFSNFRSSGSETF